MARKLKNVGKAFKEVVKGTVGGATGLGDGKPETRAGKIFGKLGGVAGSIALNAATAGQGSKAIDIANKTLGKKGSSLIASSSKIAKGLNLSKNQNQTKQSLNIFEKGKQIFDEAKVGDILKDNLGDVIKETAKDVGSAVYDSLPADDKKKVNDVLKSGAKDGIKYWLSQNKWAYIPIVGLPILLILGIVAMFRRRK